jgi:hypothetical protein
MYQFDRKSEPERGFLFHAIAQVTSEPGGVEHEAGGGKRK